MVGGGRGGDRRSGEGGPKQPFPERLANGRKPSEKIACYGTTHNNNTQQTEIADSEKSGKFTKKTQNLIKMA